MPLWADRPAADDAQNTVPQKEAAWAEHMGMQWTNEDAWRSSVRQLQGSCSGSRILLRQAMLSPQGVLSNMMLTEPAQQAAQQCMQT